MEDIEKLRFFNINKNAINITKKSCLHFKKSLKLRKIMYKISSFKTLWVSKMTIETVNTPKNYLFPIIYFRFSTNSNKSINFFSKWCPCVGYNVLRSTNWYNILLPYWNQIKNIFDPPTFNLFLSDFGHFQTGALFQKILEGSKNFLAPLSHPHPFLIGFQPLWNQFSKFSDIF